MSGTETEIEDWEHDLPRILPPNSQQQSGGPSVAEVTPKAKKKLGANQKRRNKRREGKVKEREVPEDQGDEEEQAPKKRGHGRPRKDQTAVTAEGHEEQGDNEKKAPKKKKRGRPSKDQNAATGGYREHEAAYQNDQRPGRAA